MQTQACAVCGEGLNVFYPGPDQEIAMPWAQAWRNPEAPRRSNAKAVCKAVCGRKPDTASRLLRPHPCPARGGSTWPGWAWTLRQSWGPSLLEDLRT